jgi:hypothetical protein
VKPDTTIARTLLVCGSLMVMPCIAYSNPVYQPPGANLTFGDVTHGKRAQSASTNPAAAAADLARTEGRSNRGTVISAAAGLEYGNIQELFDFYDEVSGTYKPSDPGDGGFPGPGQLPEIKDWGKVLSDIWDNADPDVRETVNAIATEVATQAALLALIKAEGHGKAWVAADAGFAFNGTHLGGAWTFGVNWSGSSKAYGLAQPIDFDRDGAIAVLEDWLNTLPINRPELLPVSDDVIISVDPVPGSVLFALTNDSSMLVKSTQTTEFNVGYSRLAVTNNSGSLFLGAEARLYTMQLSRVSVRFGDITDSEELFDAIRDSDFRTDEGAGIDVGALWIGRNYQLGAQITNVNEPSFKFPDVDLSRYSSLGAIDFLISDQKYTMDRQVKLEASLFSNTRRWSAHLGYDADPATDPMGDDFQWLTLSAGVTTDSWWIPSARIGYRENLAGTKLKYLGIGVTAFKYVNIDVSSALDTVQIDGRELPQGLMLSLGFEINW